MEKDLSAWELYELIEKRDNRKVEMAMENLYRENCELKKENKKLKDRVTYLRSVINRLGIYY